jgi:hypothetical protein
MHINIIYSFIKHFNYPIDYYFPYNINNDDVLLLIRIGILFIKGKNSEVLDPGYYIQILEKYAFSKVYINIYPNNDVYSSYYLSYFLKYNPIILGKKTEKVDFFLPNKFNHVISSNSTFIWWSLFFQM